MKYPLIFVLLLISTTTTAQACSGDVEVHGVPNKIELASPFCVPAPKDSGAE